MVKPSATGIRVRTKKAIFRNSGVMPSAVASLSL
jgi:hypothetical protein